MQNTTKLPIENAWLFTVKNVDNLQGHLIDRAPQSGVVNYTVSIAPPKAQKTVESVRKGISEQADETVLAGAAIPEGAVSKNLNCLLYVLDNIFNRNPHKLRSAYDSLRCILGGEKLFQGC